MSVNDYCFTRDIVDNNRINLQHYLWIELFGYHIHPAIPTSNPTLRIADIGTGTGIWLTDLARRLPDSVSLDGLDISFDAAPPPKWLPSNITLKSFDIKADVPDHLRGIYDIVHIRNFSFIIRDPEIEQVTRNLLQVLKPGGYIQWAEPDVDSFRINKGEPDSKIDALRNLAAACQDRDSLFRGTWVAKLSTVLEDIGLEEVQADVKDGAFHTNVAIHECNLVIPLLIARKMKDKTVEERVKQLMPEAEKETGDGSHFAFTRYTVIGRKGAE
ncbi:S-adenosyl-L-methionine-dependent methyltransferase [Aspergillus ellipticus CBS 707.79]|uniref:S-adenosyl-L-methionine-dependent methyltransferase n=1 Tax=Aspergillus ellipticus CBS 707.79 TaxID=1448320 RepID=A0A319D494_9EURO|nr:S-adenosyl-L-methionine-dependent methyltransferase [Aspergillus ellipticus CBS 707.79]